MVILAGITSDKNAANKAHLAHSNRDEVLIMDYRSLHFMYGAIKPKR